ncbi:Hypothetical predicted protein [Podarcis lilfordi]|uniref:Uncharacterized protein n=1 Tax=Podarcis lilfordi TaxID=74358 RepID=A0AA35KA81_9SAUR|nr:Hypothetical predicted protein [Podarcis lilfordi]
MKGAKEGGWFVPGLSQYKCWQLLYSQDYSVLQAGQDSSSARNMNVVRTVCLPVEGPKILKILVWTS